MAIVVTLRNGEPSVFDGIDAVSVELSPLARGAAEALVGTDLARRVGARAAEHVHRAAQGNPLALLELANAAEAGPRLTAQERRILRLAAAGATNEQISETLGVTPRNVDHDLHQIYDKLGVTRRSELVRVLKQDRPRTKAQPADSQSTTS